MKTMRKGTEPPIRVKESDVAKKLAEGFAFCNKEVWKKEVRNCGNKTN